MSVRHALLAILDQGACYGYQLRAEYARRTGAAVNVGQVYTTLERLERDGLVRNAGADERGHVYWGITEAGRAHASDWLQRPADAGSRNGLALKIALAATLPGVDAGAVIARQRAASAARLARIAARAEGSPDVSGAILRAAESAHARAEIEWLDAAAVAVAAQGAHAGYPLSADRPRRGRPPAAPDQAG